MAGPKKGAALEMIFGAPMGKGHGMPMGDDDSHDEARDMLVSAFHDVGIKGEEASSLVDALHEYIESCMSKHGAAPEEEEEEGSPESGRY